MTVYLQVRHSHCTRDKFTVLVSFSSELAVHVCSIVWPNVGADSSAVGLYCVRITPSYHSKHFDVYCCLLLNADMLADNAARQKLLIAVSQVVLYCVKKARVKLQQCNHKFEISLLV